MFTYLDLNFNSFSLSARFISDMVSFENESTLHHALFTVNKELFHCCSRNQNGYLIKHYVSHYRTLLLYLLWFHDFLFKIWKHSIIINHESSWIKLTVIQPVFVVQGFFWQEKNVFKSLIWIQISSPRMTEVSEIGAQGQDQGRRNWLRDSTCRARFSS